MGVFATRSPFRPNPIGLSCVRLEAIEDDVDEFVSALEKIMQLCDIWTKRIKGILEDGETSGSTENHIFFHP
jgi:hypothetical protein